MFNKENIDVHFVRQGGSTSVYYNRTYVGHYSYLTNNRMWRAVPVTGVEDTRFVSTEKQARDYYIQERRRLWKKRKR